MHTVTFRLIFIVSLFSRLCFAENYSDTNQILMQSSDDSGPKVGSAAMTTPKIAIIGAGIAGASSAHHLHQLARLRQPLDITVFEADGQVADVSEVHMFTMSRSSALRLAQQLSKRMTGA